jgi:hypothetical protein
LKIESYDYDAFFGDDLIGTTTIDLDDRFYNKEWMAIEHKPVEYRDLMVNSSTVSQGNIKLWVDIDESSSKKAGEGPIDISPEPPVEFEARLIIWKTKDIECMDFEGTSDIFVRSFFDPKEDYLTDTHWRCTTGIGSFNWRNLIKVFYKKGETYNLSI